MQPPAYNGMYACRPINYKIPINSGGRFKHVFDLYMYLICTVCCRAIKPSVRPYSIPLLAVPAEVYFNFIEETNKQTKKIIINA